MLPETLLKDKFWLLLAMIVLVVIWSMPVVAQALDAESEVTFALGFALVWSVLMAGLGLFLYAVIRKKPSWTSATIVLALASLILLYRTPLSFVEPQFKSEDGTLFYAQQRDLGWTAFVTPYNGYYHTVVRILVALIAPSPTLFTPAFYALAWLGIFSAALVYILAQYPDKKWAPVIAMVPALVAHTGEVFMSMTYTVWIAGLALTAFVLLPVPNFKKLNRYLLTGVLLIFSLSGPFSAALASFYFFRWIANRKSFSWNYVAAVVLGAVIQLFTIHARNAHEVSGTPFAWTDLRVSLHVAVLRVPWSLAVGHQPENPYWLIGLFLTLVLLGFIAREIMTNFRKHIFPMSCLTLCAVFVVLDFVRIQPLAILANLLNGDRYFYIPKVLFVWALIHLATTARNPRPFCIALLFCVLGSIAEFNSQEILPDNHWARYAVLIDQGQPVSVPTNPPGWTIEVNGHNAASPK